MAFTSLVVLAIGTLIIGVSIAVLDAINSKEKRKAGFIKLPQYGEDENAHAVYSKFQSAGFTNINMVNLKDIVLGIVKKSGSIESVKIDGNPSPITRWFKPDVNITIVYRGRPNE